MEIIKGIAPYKFAMYKANPEERLLSVVLHKVVGGDLEGFVYTLPDRNARHDHNNPAPIPIQGHRIDLWTQAPILRAVLSLRRR